jgi:hypothetical protein
MGLGTVLLLLSYAVPAASAPPASKSGTAGPAGGSPAIGARLSREMDGSGALAIATCASAPCAATGPGGPIGLTDIDLGKSTIEAVDVGGKKLLRVVARSAKASGTAWEALVAAKDGKAQLLWSGTTGFDSEGEGARLVFEEGTFYVGRLRRELTLCGQSVTLLEPRRLDPAKLELRRVAKHRLAQSVRDAAPTLMAEPGDKPIASVATVRGASVNDGASTALADDDPATAWTETLKGDGKGEFVVFAVPKTTEVQALSLVVRPTKASAEFAQPTSLWLTTDDATYRISLPVESEPGARLEVKLPKPVSTSCIALSLDAAEKKDAAIGLAEVDAVPILPSTIHAVDDLVTLLDDEKMGELAQRVLANAGARGAKAIAAKIDTLGDQGRLPAIDALEAAPCEAAAPALVDLSWKGSRATTTRAREGLDGCGVGAKGAIAARFVQGPDAARELLAERYAKLDPTRAVPAILEVVRTAPASRRRTFRVALAKAASSAAGRSAIATFLAAPPAPKPEENDPVIELARAIAGTVDVPGLPATLLAHAAEDRPFASRWLAALPIAELAARGDLTAVSWMRKLFQSKDRYLRARAAEVSGKVDALRPELVGALADGDPRVRQGALVALRAGSGPTGAVSAIMAMLARDGWTYVRVAAAETLGESKGGGDVDVALAKATEDEQKTVRGAAVRALVSRRAKSQLPALRSRAFDDKEVIEVRRDAVEGLGILCDTSSLDDLFEIAKKGEGGPLQLAAIMALGAIHPADLAGRLSAIDQTSLVVKDAIRRALKSPATCT